MQYPTTITEGKNNAREIKGKNNEETIDELRQFQMSEIIDKEVEIEKMGPEELIKYCHNEWTLWMKHILQLQECIRQEEEEAAQKETTKSTNRPVQTKIEDEANNEPYVQKNKKLESEHIPPKQPMYHPPFMGKDFEAMMRSQNQFPISSTNFMPGALNPQPMQMKSTASSLHPQYFSNQSQINSIKNQFPFPFPQNKSIAENFTGKGYEQTLYNQGLKRQFPEQDKFEIPKIKEKETFSRQ